MQWDLSDLTENNSGLWPAPIAYFDHFCVKVSIDYPGDINPGNNRTQHNIGHVISMSPLPRIPFVVANSDPEPRTYELLANIPEKWTLHVRGLEKRTGQAARPATEAGKGETITTDRRAVKFTLEPGEERLLTLAIIPAQKPKERRPVAVTLLMDGKPVGGFSLLAGPGTPFRMGARRTTDSVPPLLTPHPEPLFFPRKEVVLRFPNQLTGPGTIIARIAGGPTQK